MGGVNRFMSPAKAQYTQTYVDQFVPLPFELMQRKAQMEQKHFDNVKDNWAAIQAKMGEDLLKIDMNPLQTGIIDTMQNQISDAITNYDGDWRQMDTIVKNVASEYNKQVTSGALALGKQSKKDYLSDVDLINKSKIAGFDKDLFGRYALDRYNQTGGAAYGNEYQHFTPYNTKDFQEKALNGVKALKPDQNAWANTGINKDGSLLLNQSGTHKFLSEKDIEDAVYTAVWDDMDFNDMVQKRYQAYSFYDPKIAEAGLAAFKKEQFDGLIHGYGKAYKYNQKTAASSGSLTPKGNAASKRAWEKENEVVIGTPGQVTIEPGEGAAEINAAGATGAIDVQKQQHDALSEDFIGMTQVENSSMFNTWKKSHPQGDKDGYNEFLLGLGESMFNEEDLANNMVWTEDADGKGHFQMSVGAQKELLQKIVDGNDEEFERYLVGQVGQKNKAGVNKNVMNELRQDANNTLKAMREKEDVVYRVLEKERELGNITEDDLIRAKQKLNTKYIEKVSLLTQEQVYDDEGNAVSINGEAVTRQQTQDKEVYNTETIYDVYNDILNRKQLASAKKLQNPNWKPEYDANLQSAYTESGKYGQHRATPTLVDDGKGNMVEGVVINGKTIPKYIDNDMYDPNAPNSIVFEKDFNKRVKAMYQVQSVTIESTNMFDPIQEKELGIDGNEFSTNLKNHIKKHPELILGVEFTSTDIEGKKKTLNQIVTKMVSDAKLEGDDAVKYKDALIKKAANGLGYAKHNSLEDETSPVLTIDFEGIKLAADVKSTNLQIPNLNSYRTTSAKSHAKTNTQFINSLANSSKMVHLDDNGILIKGAMPSPNPTKTDGNYLIKVGKKGYTKVVIDDSKYGLGNKETTLTKDQAVKLIYKINLVDALTVVRDNDKGGKTKYIPSNDPSVPWQKRADIIRGYVIQARNNQL